MRRALAALLGIGIAISLAIIKAPAAAASDEKSNCYHYPIGTICVVRGWDYPLSVPYFYGMYSNTGTSKHTGHIDLYIWSNVASQGNSFTIAPGHYCMTDTESVIGNAEVHADFVDKSGTHFHSPTERAFPSPPSAAAASPQRSTSSVYPAASAPRASTRSADTTTCGAG